MKEREQQSLGPDRYPAFHELQFGKMHFDTERGWLPESAPSDFVGYDGIFLAVDAVTQRCAVLGRRTVPIRQRFEYSTLDEDLLPQDNTRINSIRELGSECIRGTFYEDESNRIVKGTQYTGGFIPDSVKMKGPSHIQYIALDKYWTDGRNGCTGVELINDVKKKFGDTFEPVNLYEGALKKRRTADQKVERPQRERISVVPEREPVDSVRVHQKEKEAIMHALSFAIDDKQTMTTSAALQAQLIDFFAALAADYGVGEEELSRRMGKQTLAVSASIMGRAIDAVRKFVNKVSVETDAPGSEIIEYTKFADLPDKEVVLAYLEEKIRVGNKNNGIVRIRTADGGQEGFSGHDITLSTDEGYINGDGGEVVSVQNRRQYKASPPTEPLELPKEGGIVETVLCILADAPPIRDPRVSLPYAQLGPEPLDEVLLREPQVGGKSQRIADQETVSEVAQSTSRYKGKAK